MKRSRSSRPSAASHPHLLGRMRLVGQDLQNLQGSLKSIRTPKASRLLHALPVKTPSKWTMAAAGTTLAAGLGLFKMVRHYLPPTRLPDAATEYEYALLLGCPNRKDGSYSSSQKARCQLAIDAYHNGMFKTLIISGASVKNEYVECEQMARYIQERCSMPIILEDKATTTWQNLENTRAMIGDVPLLILTGSLHARRASAMARSFFSHYGLLFYPDTKPKHIAREVPSRAVYIKMEMEKDWNQLRRLMDFPHLHDPHQPASSDPLPAKSDHSST